MPQIAPQDWLDHHSGRLAQECAVRLCLACSAILPTDPVLKELVEGQIRSDILSMALRGRRVMEGQKLKSATISADSLWPRSSSLAPKGNLFDVLGVVKHAREIVVVWEKLKDSSNPYKGREAIFAGKIVVTSDHSPREFAIGALAASYIGAVANQLPTNDQKAVDT
ncbi:MAG: hypothetical protein QNL54_10025 [Rhodobacterales bacterium]